MAKDKATVTLDGDNKPLKKELAESKVMLTNWASNIASNLQGSFAKITSAVGGTAVLGPIVGFVAALGVQIGLMNKSIKAAEEAEPVWVKLNQLLKNTGYSAGFTLDQIKELAKGIQELTTFEDESAASAATMLLKFKSIKGDLFKDAMRSAADLATLLGQDLPGAARILGRALEEPTRGMMMLRRAGIVLTAAEKEHIKTLVEQNKHLEAQKVLLKAVNDIVGGQSAAALNTVKGSSQQLSNVWSDLWETLGEDLLPAVREFNKLLTQIVLVITGFAEKTKYARDSIFNVVAAFFKASAIIIKHTAEWSELVEGIVEFKDIYEGISDWFIERLADGTAGIVNFKDMVIINLEEMLLGAMGIFKRLADAANTVFGSVTDEFKDMSKGLQSNIGVVGADYVKRLLKLMKSRREIEEQLRNAGKGEEESGGGKKPRPDGADTATGKGIAGTFEGIEELYKRISSASAGATPADRAAEAAEDTAEEMEEAVAALRDNETQLIRVNEQLAAIAQQLPVGVLS